MPGESITVPGTRLLAFVDETGEESLRDPKYPVFGLAGCTMRADAYFGYVAKAWREMKASNFGGSDGPLHASSVDPNNTPGVEALAHFFRTQHFSRFGVTLTHITERAGFDAYQLTASSLLEQFRKTARYWSGIDGITFICEQSARGDELARKYLGGWRYWRELNGERVYIPVYRHFMPKSTNEPGLEIADFIAHTIGANSRSF